MRRPDLVMTAEDLELDARLGAIMPTTAHQRPLSAAAARDELDLAFIQRDSVLPRVWAKARNLPLVAVVTDTVGRPAGPATWLCAGPLVEWAEIAILHRAGTEMRHYAHAVELAKTYLRTLLIEAPAETFEDWLALLHGRAGLPVEVLR